jgi:hypothetical protein
LSAARATVGQLITSADLPQAHLITHRGEV